MEVSERAGTGRKRNNKKTQFKVVAILKLFIYYIYFSEAICLNYRVTAKGVCDFRKELLNVALANPIKDICNPSQTFPRRCSIHNHPEFSYKYALYPESCLCGLLIDAIVLSSFVRIKQNVLRDTITCQ